MSTLDTARAWLAQDPDPVTREELTGLIAQAEAGDAAALESAFAGRLEFGTAGLRGELGAGSARMNRVSVAQAAAGLASFLLRRGAHPSVVIGYDGRVNSDVFARDTAEIMAGAGVRALLLPGPAPTPVTAFAVRDLDVSAGVMVTASHNPPRDNGFKVYLGDADQGSQIVAPVDAEIAAEIELMASRYTFDDLPKGTFEQLGDDVRERYVSATAALGQPGASSRVVYTAMHGVGWLTTRDAVAAAGFEPLIPVAEQRDPDGAFPTVAFPNPEEPGALDLAMATADRESAELIIANDPDADRLSVCVPVEGGWQQLTGNEVGLIFGWDAAKRLGTGTLACSIVSSPGLESIAKHFGLEFQATLTGFKWVSRVDGLVYGYEEALGYLVNPETVRDKDGISALLRILSIHGALRAEGRTLLDLLDEIATTVGAYASGQVSVRVTDLARIPATMAALRATPPTELAGVAVTAADDLNLPEHGSIGNILRFTMADGSRVMVRPSGTEPKVKVYIDSVDATGDQDAARALVSAYAEAMRPLVA